jgi:hypothetical protein
MLNKDSANEALKYKNILRETTYNSLISKIKKHDIDKVFITNKMNSRCRAFIRKLKLRMSFFQFH